MSEFRPTTTDMAPWLEQAWMERYLNRELTEDESDWFEAYLLDRPRTTADLNADSELRTRYKFLRTDGLLLFRRIAIAAVIVSAVAAIFLFRPDGRSVDRLVIANQPSTLILSSHRNIAEATWETSSMVSKSEIIIVAVPATSKFGMLEVGVNGEIFNLGPVNADNGYFNFLMTKRLAMGQLTLISDSNRQPLPKIR